MQIRGLATALKVLFQSSRDLDKPSNKLSKTEIIALMNTLNRLSESVDYYEKFLAMEDEQRFSV
jgi:hypothetical protein